MSNGGKDFSEFFKEVVGVGGYTGSEEEFKRMVQSDSDAFDQAFEFAELRGYEGSEQEFAQQMGLAMPQMSNGDGDFSQFFEEVVSVGGYPGTEEEFKRMAQSDSDAFDQAFEFAGLRGFKGNKYEFAQQMELTMPIDYVAQAEEIMTPEDESMSVDVATASTGDFGDFIASGESRGDYNAYNYFTGEGDSKQLVSKINAQGEDFIPFTEMTIAEVQELQSQRKVFAAGKYQVIPITLNDAIKDLGLDPNQKFSKEVQEQIFNEYLITAKKNRGALEAYLNGESDDLAAAIRDAALEFASLPVDESGKSEYGDDGFNEAQHSYEETVAALKKERARRAGGLDAAVAEKQSLYIPIQGQRTNDPNIDFPDWATQDHIDFSYYIDSKKRLKRQEAYLRSLRDVRGQQVFSQGGATYDIGKVLGNIRNELKNLDEEFGNKKIGRQYLKGIKQQEEQQTRDAKPSGQTTPIMDVPASMLAVTPGTATLDLREEEEQFTAKEVPGELVDEVSKAYAGTGPFQQNKFINKLQDELAPYGFRVTPAAGKDLQNKFQIRSRDGEVRTFGFVVDSGDYPGGYPRTAGGGSVFRERQELENFVAAKGFKPEQIYTESDKESAQKFRDKGREARATRINSPNRSGDGHKMAFGSDERGALAYPTLFPRDPENQTTNPEDWIDLSDNPEAALEEARRRKEVYRFRDEATAQKFAEGGYQGDQVNQVRMQAYGGLGLDAQQYEDLTKDIEDIESEILFLKGLAMDDTRAVPGGGEGSRRVGLSTFLTGQMVTNPNKQKMVLELKQKLKDLYRIRADFDPAERDFNDLLNEEQGVILSEMNLQAEKIAQNEQAVIEDFTRTFGGVDNTLEDVIDFMQSYQVDPVTGRPDEVTLRKLQSYQRALNGRVYLSEDLANNTLRYGDMTLARTLRATPTRDELVGARQTFVDNFNAGLARGQAGVELFKLIHGGADENEVQRRVAKLLSEEQAPQKISLGQYYAETASGASGIARAFKKRPLEVLAYLTSQSIGQLLPPGAYMAPRILPATTGYGGLAGGLPGAIAGLTTGLKATFVAAGFMMEYTNALMESAASQGYDLTDPNSFYQSLQDEDVWKAGAERGVARGIPIAVVNGLTASLSGRMLLPKGGVFSSPAARVGALAAEQFTLQPIMEAGGEALAQIVAGDELDSYEILSEALGSFGMGASMGTLNIASDMYNNKASKVVDRFNRYEELLGSNLSFKSIEEGMQTLQRRKPALAPIIQEVRQKMQNIEAGNVIFKEAGRFTEGNGVTAVSREAQGRVAELIGARNRFEANKPVFRKQIQEINDEIAKIVETNEVVENPIPDSRLGITREAYAEYLGALGDTELVRINVKSLDEVPAEYRDTAAKKEGPIVLREEVNGLRIGDLSEEVDGYYTYFLTGKQARDAFQKQETRDLSDAERAEGVSSLEEKVRQSAETEADEEIRNFLKGEREQKRRTRIGMTERARPEAPMPVGEEAAPPTVEQKMKKLLSDSLMKVHSAMRRVLPTTPDKALQGLSNLIDEVNDYLYRRGRFDRGLEGLDDAVFEAERRSQIVKIIEKAIDSPGISQPMASLLTSLNKALSSNKVTEVVIKRLIGRYRNSLKVAAQKLVEANPSLQERGIVIAEDGDIKSYYDALNAIAEDPALKPEVDKILGDRVAVADVQRSLYQILGEVARVSDVSDAGKTAIVKFMEFLQQDTSDRGAPLSGAMTSGEMLSQTPEASTSSETIKAALRDKSKRGSKQYRTNVRNALRAAQARVEEMIRLLEKDEQGIFAGDPYSERMRAELKAYLADINEVLSDDYSSSNIQINKFVNRARKALAKIAPNVSIVVHRTKADLNESLNTRGKNAAFDPRTNTIHIARDNFNRTRLSHEAVHAILFNRLHDESAIRRATESMVKKLRKQVPKDVQEELDLFTSRYKYKYEQNEEFISQLTGLIASRFESFSQRAKDIVTEWLNKLSQKFGFGPVKKGDTLDMLLTIAGKIDAGEEITTEDVAEIDAFATDDVGFVPTEIGVTQPRRGLYRLRAQEEAPSQNQDVLEDVKAARNRGFSDTVIAKYLMSEYGFDAQQAAEATLGYTKPTLEAEMKEASTREGQVGDSLSKINKEVEEAYKDLEGVSSRKLKRISEAFSEYFGSIDLVFKSLFGRNNADKILKLMGYDAFAAGKAKAIRTVRDHAKQYSDKYKNVKDFKSAQNTLERSVYARLKRNKSTDSIEDQNKEFQRRLRLRLQQIQAKEMLGKNIDIDREISDKLGLDELQGKSYAEAMQILESRMEQFNIDAVNDMAAIWAEYSQAQKDTAAKYYGIDLDLDSSYTSDTYRMSEGQQAKYDDNDGYITGVAKSEGATLKTVTDPQTLFIDGKPEDGVSFLINDAFEAAQFARLEQTLINVFTAEANMKIDEFLRNSKGLEGLLPDSTVRDLVVKKLQDYVLHSRYNIPQSPTGMDRALSNKNTRATVRLLSKIGSSMSLSSVSQIFKQSVPMFVGASITAGPQNVMNGISTYSKNKSAVNEFLKKAGAQVANRGMESDLAFDTAAVEVDDDSTFTSIAQAIEKAPDALLNMFVKSPDVFTAKSTFLAYYLKYLQDNNISTDIQDWSSLEPNPDAVAYADRKVSEQQASSDREAMGKLFSGRKASSRVLMQVMAPFATHASNMKYRIYSNVGILMDENMSQEDKSEASRDLIAALSESVMFNAVALGTTMALANLFMGKYRDDEKLAKKLQFQLKYRGTQVFMDMLMPIPDLNIGAGTDNMFKSTVNSLVGEEVMPVFDEDSDLFSNIGIIGIAPDEFKQGVEYIMASQSGKLSKNFGPIRYKKNISPEDRNILMLAGIATILGTAVGSKDLIDAANTRMKAQTDE